MVGIGIVGEMIGMGCSFRPGEVCCLDTNVFRSPAEPGRRSGNALALLDYLFETPVMNVKQVEKRLEVSQPTANSLVNDLEQIGLLRELTVRRRDRRFSLDEYMQLFKEREQRS